MKKTLFTIGIFTGLAWLGCGSTDQTPSTPTTEVVDSIPKTGESLPDGHQTRVFAIGFPWHGDLSTEWELYEEYVTNDAGLEIYRKSHFSLLEECVTTQYDSMGHETLRVYTTSDVGDKSEFRSTWNADFTEKTTVEYAPKEGRTVSTTQTKYDGQGRVILMTTEDTRVPDVVQKTQLRNVFDAKGRLSEIYEVINGKELLGTRHTYDAAGKLLKSERFDAGGKPSQNEFLTYNAQGLLQERRLQDFGAYHTSPQLSARFTYNAEGRLASEIRYFPGNCDPAGEQAGRCVVSETITYTYDSEGRLATEAHEKAGNPRTTASKRYEYMDQSPTGNMP